MSDVRGDAFGLAAINPVIRRLRACRSADQVASMAARMTRSITGFDLVTLYCIGEDGSRRICAQSLAFAGRRPPQALPVASMSLALVVENRLWGVITCHDRAPSTPSRRTCALCDLVAEVAAIQVEAIQRSARCQVGRSVGHWRARFSEQISRGRSIGEAIRREGRGLLTLMGSTGLAVLERSERHLLGETPAESALDALMDRLVRAGPTQTSFVFHVPPGCDSLAGLGKRAAGIFVIPLAPASDRFLVFFRSEPRHEDLLPADAGSGPAAWTERQRWLAAGLRIVAIEAFETDQRTLAALALEDAARQRSLAAGTAGRVRDVLSLAREMLEPQVAGALAEGFGESALGLRVDILASAYEQLTGSDARVGSLTDMIKAEIAALRAREGGCALVSGLDVDLNGDALATMTMVVHELLRDAGCAAASNGGSGAIEVEITRSHDSGVVVIWRAAIVGTVHRPWPHGFGAVVVERAVRVGLGGCVSTHDVPGGRVVRIEMPGRHVAGSSPGPINGDPVGEVVPGMPFADRSVLIAEDDALHAVSLEIALAGMGFVRVECAGSVEQALRRMEAGLPDCAVLDVHLGHEVVFDVADRLRAAGVPFLFVACHGEGALIPARFDDVQVLGKPAPDASLARALARSLSTPVV